MKAYRKPFTRLVEEGTYISSHKGELLNSKNEWHQAKLVRTTTRVIQGGAELLQRGGEGGGSQGARAGTRTWGQWASFFKHDKSERFSFWSRSSHIFLDWSFYQLKWPGPQVGRNSFPNKFTIIQTSQYMNSQRIRKTGAWLLAFPRAGNLQLSIHSSPSSYRW